MLVQNDQQANAFLPVMISIELDSRGGGTIAGAFGSAQVQALSLLLDRCDQENIRDISLRLPAAPTADFAASLRPLLKRPFRFSAWFRASPPAALAQLLLSTGHRITLTATAFPDGDELERALGDPALAAGAPWQVNLFLAVPTPPHGAATRNFALKPRAGTNLTLGLGWADPESGPRGMWHEAERLWAEALLELAAWWTERDVTVHLACGLPLCLFSTEQLGRLALLKVRLPLALCAPSLVVTLDGRARVCPRLPAGGWMAMPAGTAFTELASQLIGPTGFFSAFCNRSAEQSCRSFTTGACGGGCMADNALMWQGGNRVSYARVQGARSTDVTSR